MIMSIPCFTRRFFALFYGKSGNLAGNNTVLFPPLRGIYELLMIEPVHRENITDCNTSRSFQTFCFELDGGGFLCYITYSGHTRMYGLKTRWYSSVGRAADS